LSRLPSRHFEQVVQLLGGDREPLPGRRLEADRRLPGGLIEQPKFRRVCLLVAFATYVSYAIAVGNWHDSAQRSTSHRETGRSCLAGFPGSLDAGEVVGSDMTSPRLVELDLKEHLSTDLDAAGLPGGQPVLVVIGGASGLRGEEEEVARRVIEHVAVPAALECEAAIVDGGTDSGVMRLVGKAHAEAGAQTPLVGVAVRRLVRVPDRAWRDVAGDAADVEPHHTHLILVPGKDWGDESPWLSAVAAHLSAGCGAVTLVVNGGAITLSDVRHSVSAGRPVVVAAGTGRSADLLVTTIRRDGSAPTAGGSGQVWSAVTSGLVDILDLDGPVAARREQLSLLLRPG
jgi:SLOG in TRPM, prokaryote